MKLPFTRYFSLLLLVAILSTCRADNRRTLFEMVFPNLTFEMPAGLTGTLPRVFTFDDLRTNYQSYITQFNIDTSLITGIEPITATLEALSNERFDFLLEVSIRICPETSASCNAAEEVFYLDNIPSQRVGSELRLLPSLPNAQRVLSRDRFKLEIWFSFFGVSPSSIPIKLDLRFDAIQ